MTRDFLRTRDFWSGLMFAGFGAAFLYIGSHYQFGSAQRMGTGFLPVILGGVLVVLGGCLAAKGFAASALRIEAFALRPLLIVVVSTVLYGVVLRPFGLVLATLLLVFSTAFIAGKLPLAKSALLAVAVTALTSVIFVIGLAIPINLWPVF